LNTIRCYFDCFKHRLFHYRGNIAAEQLLTFLKDTIFWN
jgi:hypothetical protein